MSEARDVLLKVSRSRNVKGEGRRRRRVYGASVGVWSADLQMLHNSKGTLCDSSGSHESCQANAHAGTHSYYKGAQIQKHTRINF